MITDHSSAGFEYLLLDRPLVRIHVPELLRGSNINEEYVRLLADAARSVDGPSDALRAVERGTRRSSGRLRRRAAPSPRISSIGPAAPRRARSTSCTTPWS